MLPSSLAVTGDVFHYLGDANAIGCIALLQKLFNQSLKVQITPVYIYALGGRHTNAHVRAGVCLV